MTHSELVYRRGEFLERASLLCMFDLFQWERKGKDVTKYGVPFLEFVLCIYPI